MAYDDQNIFAQILRGEITPKIVHETAFTLAFLDHAPKAPIHILVIPKGQYVSFDDFSAHASAEEMADLIRVAGHVARQAGADSSGYRLMANHGRDSRQEVPHFHLHILGGKYLGPMLAV